jgi:hypothetical protein
LRHAQIGVEKPKHFSSRHLSARIHLRSAAALRNNYKVGQWLGDYLRPIRAAAIDDNDLRFRRDRPDMLKEVLNLRRFIQHRHDD